jgi:hypothetical protein
MKRGRIASTVVAGVAAVLLAVPGALAATPREIARDYADNGRLDKAYSRADLERALNNALLQEYETPQQGGLESEINERISQQGIASAKRVSALPFTGVDLALMAFGGGLLLLLGASLRRAARNKAKP